MFICCILTTGWTTVDRIKALALAAAWPAGTHTGLQHYTSDRGRGPHLGGGAPVPTGPRGGGCGGGGGGGGVHVVTVAGGEVEDGGGGGGGLQAVAVGEVVGRRAVGARGGQPGPRRAQEPREVARRWRRV